MALTPEQQKIVSATEKHCQVVAGAGCGKTHTIIEFIRHRLAGGLSPGRFLLITFTRKAAAEMAGRLKAENGRPYIGTFHAMALRLLKQHFPESVDGFDLLDEHKSQEARYKSGRKYIHRLSGRRLDLVLGAKELPPGLEEVRQCIEADYAQWKFEQRYLDFDDLLTLWEKCMSAAPGKKRTGISAYFKVVVVDEFQDTGAKEMSFLRTFNPDQLLVVVPFPLTAQSKFLSGFHHLAQPIMANGL